MKRLMLIVVCSLGAIFLYGQKNVKIGGVNPQTIAFFVDSVLVYHEGFDINEIDSIQLVRESIEINGKSFQSQIYCFSSKQFKFISLQELSEKYRNENKLIYSPVFIINGNILTGKALSFKVDENYLLNVKCINSDELGYWEGKEPFTMVSILTKIQKNINQCENSTIFPNNTMGLKSEEWERQKKALVEFFAKKSKEENLRN